jgi:hypothetical protein
VEPGGQRQVPEQSVQVFSQFSLNQQVVQITETMAEIELQSQRVMQVAGGAELEE